MVDYKRAISKIRAKCFIIFPNMEIGEKTNQPTSVLTIQFNKYKKEVNDLLDLLEFTVMEKVGLKLLL